MPEGPELLYFAVVFNKKFKNAKIDNILSFTDKPVVIPIDFDGKITNVDSKGKLLFFEVTGDKKYYVHIHYGITGWLTFAKPDKNVKFEFIIKKGSKEYRMYMEDRRRFSKIGIYDEKQHNQILNKLGVDIFTDAFTLDFFKNTIKSKKTMLAALLLKQDIFAGIGNYIKNDAMYLTNLKAKVKTSELTDEQIKDLYNNILFIAYSNLFEFLKDSKADKYLFDNRKHNKPKKLEIPYKFKVYAREGEEIDGKKIYKIKVAGRDSYCTKELC
jgi:formamidopyrimidine-DNA glycosylase